ncbi:MAG: hypothetical protein ACLP6E_10955 [Acidimicrobiales bacterium]
MSDDRAGKMPQSSLEHCIERLDRFSCQVAQALALTAPEPTRQELLSLIGPDARPDEVERALDVLHARRLIDSSGETIRIDPAIRGRRSPAGLGPRAAELLSLRSPGELSAIAWNNGMTDCLEDLTREQLVARVAMRLTAPDRVSHVLHEAPSDVVGLAMRLAFGTPTITTSAGFSTGYRRTAPERSWRAPHHWLLRRGLVIEKEWYRAVMPLEVAMVLRGGRPFETVTAVRPPLFPMAVDASQVEVSARSMAARIVAAVGQLIVLWGSRPARVVKKGEIAARDLRKFSSASGIDPGDAPFVFELAGFAGLVGVDYADRIVLPRAPCHEWLDRPFELRWKSLVETWLEVPAHPGRSSVEPTRGKTGLAPFDRAGSTAAVEQRKLCLAALVEADPGTGVDEDSLSARLEWETPLLWSKGPATPASKVAWICSDAQLLGILHGGSLSGPGREVARGNLHTAASLLADRSGRPETVPASSNDSGSRSEFEGGFVHIAHRLL